MRGSATRAVVPALVVLALLAVVAVAATGSTSTGTDRVRPPAATLLDTVFSLGLLAVLAGGVLFVYGLMQRKEIGREIASGRYRRASIMGWILFTVVFTAFTYWRLRRWEFSPTEPDITDVVRGQTTPPRTSPDNANVTQYEPQLAWIPIAVVLGLVATAVVAYVVSEQRARRRASERETLRAHVTDLLDETLEDLRAESDPRRAVIAAYARLEHALAANGVRRGQAETEEEYLGRFLGSLEVSERAARRLTDLFEWARFSQHAVDVEMKEEAIGALEQLRDELRHAREARDEAPEGQVATSGAAS